MAEQDLPLAGKIALVTGSSQGIGRATALRLAQSGADIIINYRRNAEAADEAKAGVEALGRRCITIQADVSQEEEVTRLFTEATNALGPVTVLVNNAGTTRDKLILQMSLADFEHVIQTNLRSAFLCTKAVLCGHLLSLRSAIGWRKRASGSAGLSGCPRPSWALAMHLS